MDRIHKEEPWYRFDTREVLKAYYEETGKEKSMNAYEHVSGKYGDNIEFYVRKDPRSTSTASHHRHIPVHWEYWYPKKTIKLKDIYEVPSSS